MSFLKQLKPGDVILAYRKGIHQVTRVERRFYTEDYLRYGSEDWKKDKEIGQEFNSLIHYRTIYNSKYQKFSGRKKWCCDEVYCSKFVIEYLNKQLEDIEKVKKDIIN